MSLSELPKMSNKALRILIADEQHFHRMKIERMLNQLGYFRIAPVHSVEELLTLVEYGSEPFDLVMISTSLTVGVDLDLLAFCVDNLQIRHGFIYDDPQARLAPNQRRKVQVSQSRMPDLELVRHLMERVDPHTHDVKLPALPGLHDIYRRKAG
jgi:DNA-binding NarL/FixJ family response regulator